MPRQLLTIPAALCAVALLAGCGDEPGPSAVAPVATQALATTAPPQPPPPPPTPTPPDTGSPDASASRRERLERSGHDVLQSRVAGLDPAPRAALELALAGGARLTVYVYASSRDARAKAAEFEPIARQAPTGAAVEVRGRAVYFALAEDEGSTLDRGAFDAAVATAEGD